MLFIEHFWTTASEKKNSLYYVQSLESVFRDEKIMAEEHDKKLATQNWFFSIKPISLKPQYSQIQ